MNTTYKATCGEIFIVLVDAYSKAIPISTFNARLTLLIFTLELVYCTTLFLKKIFLQEI